ncbi:MAG: DUF3857 and transglutaminase domain-containing protein, partial [Gemmatimonadota bacterium]|nr:DUF3857 and transglutaminase domain-containing protein [Gemmatimonadota bacterium]
MTNLRFAPFLFSVLVPFALSDPSLAQENSSLQSFAQDSIQSLAVNPKDYRGQEEVYLVDEGDIRLEADGTYIKTYRQAVQVLTADAADEWGEFSFGYYPSYQRFTLNWMRVTDTGGTLISEGPEHQQSTSPSAREGSPIYSDREVIQMTVGGVAPGTIVDYSYTIETFDPKLPRDFWVYWMVNSTIPARRSRLTVDFPDGYPFNIREMNIDFDVDVKQENGRTVRTWQTTEVPAITPQSFMGFPNDRLIAVQMSGGLSWNDIFDWYSNLSQNRQDLTRDILDAHDAQLTGARTLEDSLKATYSWVAQDFRYVSLSLGDGAYQPRTPAEVFRTGFGDCKDKANFFVSLARRMGVEAYPVLVNSTGGVDSLSPSILQFDHMIAAIKRNDDFEYFDLTTTLTPFGEIPYSLQGEVAIVLVDGSGPNVEVMPLGENNLYEREIRGVIDRQNRFVGSVTISGSGSQQYGLRSDFTDFAQLDQEDRDDLLNQYAVRTSWQTATVDSSHTFEGRDIDQPASVTIWFTVEKLLGEVNGDYIVQLPSLNFVNRTTADRLDAEGERLFPIDMADVNGPAVWRSSVELQLPDRWTTTIPDDITVEGPFGDYHANFRQVGNTVSLSREMRGRHGIQPADSIDALKTWFEEVG